MVVTVQSKEHMDRFAEAVAKGHALYAHPDTIAHLQVQSPDFAAKITPNEFIERDTIVAIDVSRWIALALNDLLFK